jgi:3-oxocholest-4-en-26-oate---CoA ligase
MALNIADLYEHAADAFPDRIALACGDKQFTFQEVDARANRLAHYLAGIGVRPGDHVGVSARNSVEAAETLIAVCKLRAVAININYRYVENELRYLLTDSDPVALVHDRQDTARMAAVADAAPGLLGTVIIDDGSEATPGAGISYDDALAAGAPDRDFGDRSSDDVYIIYTGGTTGLPKGVMWRHEDIWRTLGGGIDFITGEVLADEWEQSRRGQESAGLVRLCTAPLIHGAAQVATLGALFSGDTVVLIRKFDPHEVWREIERHKVNVMMVIGDAMARPLIEAYHEGSYDASSLVSLSSSAALFSPVVKDACAAALPNVFITEAIGSTETGFAGIGLVQAGAESRGGPTVSIGPEVVVLTEQGALAGPGVVGKLARGGHVPLGYYKDPVKTAAMFAEVDGKRYAVPGDWARIEADGTITLLGRGNTCVNTGGEKVFPEEVEGALKSHPAVFDAVVIGVPDETLGQRVAALVQVREGMPIDLDELVVHVRSEIAGYKVPRSVWLVGAISRTAAGKADYGWARRYVAEHPPSAGRPAGASQPAH